MEWIPKTFNQLTTETLQDALKRLDNIRIGNYDDRPLIVAGDEIITLIERSCRLTLGRGGVA